MRWWAPVSIESMFAPMVDERRDAEDAILRPPPGLVAARLGDEHEAAAPTAADGSIRPAANCTAICAGRSVVLAAAACHREAVAGLPTGSAGSFHVHSPVAVLYQYGAW